MEQEGDEPKTEEHQEETPETVFQAMLSNRRSPCDLKYPSEPPVWLDKEKCREGRKYFFKNLLGVNISNYEALIMGLCLPTFYRPLVITGKTIIRRESLQRYLETGVYVFSWYQDDCWEEGVSCGGIKRVNAMHRAAATKVNNLKDNIGEEVAKVFENSGVDLDDLTDLDKVLLDNIAELRKDYDVPEEFTKYMNESVPFSEFDMTLVQGAFFAQFLLYPSNYGAKYDSKEEVNDFVHLWRVHGYYLGIQDENNAVLPVMEDTLALACLLMNKILIPSMLHMNKESVYLAKNATFGSMDYHVIVYCCFELVGIRLDKLWDSFSWAQRLKYWTRTIFWYHVYPIPIVRWFINRSAFKVFDKLMTRFLK